MTPDIPNVNQETNSAEDTDRMELKRGIALARTKAKTQKIVPMLSQTTQVRFVFWSYSCLIFMMLRTSENMNLIAVWPNTSEVPSRVGRRTPYATLAATGGAVPSAGLS